MFQRKVVSNGRISIYSQEVVYTSESEPAESSGFGLSQRKVPFSCDIYYEMSGVLPL